MPRIHRRTFLEQSLLGAGLTAISPALLQAAKSDNVTSNQMKGVRTKTLKFIESMRFNKQLYGQYRYAKGMVKPTLYSSTYAAMTRHLYRDLDNLSKKEKQEWITYLQSHQDADGLYRDPVIFGEGWYKDDPLWCGRPHLSCHVVAALTCLRDCTTLESTTCRVSFTICFRLLPSLFC